MPRYASGRQEAMRVEHAEIQTKHFLLVDLDVFPFLSNVCVSEHAYVYVCVCAYVYLGLCVCLHTLQIVS